MNVVGSISQVAKEKPSEKTHGQGLRNFPANWILEDEALRYGVSTACK